MEGYVREPLGAKGSLYAAIESAILSDWSCMTTVSR